VKLNNLTFVIFTFNEEKRIERVIKNLKNYGNILIADNQSTDRTLEIAKKYGCDIFIRTKKCEFVETQEMMDDLEPFINTDWLYWAFADEMLEKSTLEEILKIIATNQYDIISIYRKNHYYGRFCYDAFASKTNKIFKKGTIDFSTNVIHGFGQPTIEKNKIYTLPKQFFVHHFMNEITQSYLNKINGYTQTELVFNQSQKNIIKLICYIFLNFFINHYILKKGYRAGMAGFHLFLMMSGYYIVKNMKLYEKNKSLSPEIIENENNKTRDNILSSFIEDKVS